MSKVSERYENFCLIHQAWPKMQAYNKLWKKLLPEWVMKQYFGGFFLTGCIQTAQKPACGIQNLTYTYRQAWDPAHPSPLRHTFKSWTSTLQLPVSIFMLPHTTSSSWEKWGERELRLNIINPVTLRGDGVGEKETESGPPPGAESRRRLHMALSFKPRWSRPLGHMAP